MKGLRHPFAFDADQRFDTKGVGAGLIMGQICYCTTSKTPVKCPQYAWGGMGSFGIAWNIK